MAAVSVLEALLLIGVAVVGYRLYGQAMQAVRDIEQRQVAPLMAKVGALTDKVDAILVDVKAVTSLVTKQTERVDAAISGTVERVDETAARVRGSVVSQVGRMFALAQGIRYAVNGMFNRRRASGEAPAA
jgi:outer membrane murein-binding lipoprotein Lpp